MSTLVAGRDTLDIEQTLTLAGCGDLDEILEDGFETVVGERRHPVWRSTSANRLSPSAGQSARHVLLDDATSAVDPAREEIILANLAALPTTVVMVTHRVAAMAAADRVALIDDGRGVRALGTHDELLDDGVPPSRRGLWAAASISGDAS